MGRSRRPFYLAWRGIKRAAGERVSNYKDRGNACLFLNQRAQLPFSFRVEVIRQIRSPEIVFQKFKTFAELPNRNFKHCWKRMISIPLKNVFILFVEPVKDVGQQLSLDLNNILRPVNEANLEIERVILGQVATARVRLRAVNVPCLIDPLETCAPMFLVELRALREVGDAVEIFQLEEIRSAFGPGRHYLRCDNLHEAPARQILPEIFQRRSLNPKYISDHVITNRQRTILQQSLLPHRFDLRRRVER